VQAGDERPPDEELADLVAAQARVTGQLRVEVAELRADDERLRAQQPPRTPCAMRELAAPAGTAGADERAGEAV
jgi:hypothetical protein